MSHRETYRGTLTYALSIAGSERALAVRLNIPIPQLLNYLYGVEPIPNEMFLLAVDVVLASTREDIAKSRVMLNQIRHPKPKE